MKKYPYLLLGFLLLAALQIYVPLSTIIEKDDVLETGTFFKFQVAPIDPNDPFRGKYITLNYYPYNLAKGSKITDSLKDESQNIFVTFRSNTKGFAEIESISFVAPKNRQDYLKTTFSKQYTSIENSTTYEVIVNYPFIRLYMEENKAPEAETIYNEKVRDTNSTAYALVALKKGNYALKDVFINNISVREIAKNKVKQ